MKTTSLFLKDLEGLRAIAVMAVVLFHVNEFLLPGGYLGVDLFFVISGYVVTKVLVERGVKGQLIDFYLNRFHRLIPASAVTIIATIALFLLFAPHHISDEFYVSALSSIFSLSNVNFYLADSYWSDELSINPFLHFWSLSVEEQFYFIWPVILYAAAIKFPQRAILNLSVLLLLSISLPFAFAALNPSASFYLMPARIFQFTSGALAFYLSFKYVKPHVRGASFLVGLTSFLALVYLLEGEDASTLTGMIVPTLSAFLILFGLQTKFSLLTLSNSLFRFLGKISYSLYLTHWPVIVLLKINYGTSFSVQLTAIVLSLSSAYLLHEKIEKKYRLHKIGKESKSSYWPKKESMINLGVFLGSILSIVIGLVFSINSRDGQQPFNEALAVQPPTAQDVQVIQTKTKGIWTCQTYEVGRLQGNTKYKLLEDLNLEQCLTGKVILIGDSWGPAAAEVLFRVYGADNVATLNSAGCRPLPEKAKSSDCSKMNAKRFDLTLLSNYDHVFISSNWHGWSASKVQKLLSYFEGTDLSVYLFSYRPNFITPIPTILKGNDSTTIDLTSYLKKPKEVNNQLLFNLSSAYEQVKVIDWYSPLTQDGRHLAYTPEGRDIYRDSSHLTPEGMKFLAKEVYKNILWR